MKTDRLQQSKLTRYFRSFRTAGIYLPSRLILPLCAGCLVLFSFFVIPLPQYKDVKPLFAERQPEVGTPSVQKKDSPRKPRMIAVRVLEMETNGRVPETAVLPGRIELVQERVGMNIFIRSGYLQEANMTDTEDYQLLLHTDPMDCAALDTEEGKNDKARSLRDTAARLAISAVAVEKFHRNVLHRRMEWAYARAFSALFGRLPDVSLGPAQIRVSSVRKIAAKLGEASGPYAMLRASDAELAQILSDECKSLKLAATMMYHFLTKALEGPACESENDPMECPSRLDTPEKIAAATYVGQRRNTNAVIDYGPLVGHMVYMIQRSEQRAAAEAEAAQSQSDENESATLSVSEESLEFAK